ncbi:MAG: hypothetical protein JWQ16_530 [Novosphingobium sp.]|jgi:hypothetical protein|nr:hypothetical protein [Novosphingobium sp.]
MRKDVLSHLLTSSTWSASPDEPLPHRAFADVSQTFLTGYRGLVNNGMAPESIAAAMLGATVNFYEMFGMSAELPELLRAVADRVECEPS